MKVSTQSARRPCASISLLAMTAALTLGCAPEQSKPGPAAAPPQSAPSGVTAATVTDQWRGQWNGPEGTYLRISGGNGVYEIAVRDLDAETTYQGIGTDDSIEFERKGVKELLRATNGAATGMKWLADKRQCLTVRAGEGYCRD